MSRCETVRSSAAPNRRSVSLASGKFAVIQRDQHFTLVPWRAILERYRGREVVGIVRGMGVSHGSSASSGTAGCPANPREGPTARSK